MARLNPGVLHKRQMRANAQKAGTNEQNLVKTKKKERLTAKIKGKFNKAANKFYKNMMASYEVQAEEE